MRRRKRELCFWMCLTVSLLASFGLAWCTAVEYAAAPAAAGAHPENDLGDAPDSSHGFGGLAMQAYPDGTAARYPTVYGPGSPPYGPIHWKPRAVAYLGSSVTLESEAAEGADEDGVNNIGPREEASNRDGGDDGVRLPLALPSGAMTSLEYTVTVVNPAVSVMYVNVWFDWNRDGDWDDLLTGSNGAMVPEWAVQNQVVALTAVGSLRLTTPSFVCWQPAGGALPPIWMRITLSEVPWSAAGTGPVAGGSGPKDGYLYGETEDYYLSPANGKWLDKSISTQAVKKEDAPAASSTPLWTQAAGDPVWQWNQLPDTTANGIAVRVDSSDGLQRILADDFEGTCVQEGVRLWGIWKNDEQGQITKIRLSVYDNDPAGLEGPDSTNDFPKPCPDTLWQREFGPSQFEETLYIGGTGVWWWWDPALGELSPNVGTQLRQITITVPSKDAFAESQTGSSRIHWLAVEVETTGEEFGLRTRPQADHSLGAAVWGSQPILAGDLQVLSSSAELWSWQKLEYPAGHPGADGQQLSIDLALSVKVVQPGSLVTVQPGSATQCPVVSTQCPATSTKCPTIWTLCPASATLCPTAHTQCPRETTKCPEAVSTMCPAVSTKCPAVSTQCPPQSTKCPPQVATLCPAASTKCPLVNTQCPVRNTYCPQIGTKCPTQSTYCPQTNTQCPVTNTHCPTRFTNCPVTNTQCPLVSTQCPTRNTYCPPKATYCPASATHCPPVATICPVVNTSCPVVNTSCPAINTRCPTKATYCPPSSTHCPVVGTQCPTLSTFCPPTLTLCHISITTCPKMPFVCN